MIAELKKKTIEYGTIGNAHPPDDNEQHGRMKH